MMKLCFKTIGKEQLKSLLHIMFGIHKISEKLKDQ